MRKLILLNTVGFISNLPPTLISAFKSTLYEIVISDLILHVCDIFNKDVDFQEQEVNNILDILKKRK